MKFLLLMGVHVDVSYRISYSIVSYLNISFCGLINSVGEERANVSSIVYV